MIDIFSARGLAFEHKNVQDIIQHISEKIKYSAKNGFVDYSESITLSDDKQKYFETAINFFKINGYRVYFEFSGFNDSNESVYSIRVFWGYFDSNDRICEQLNHISQRIGN